jgi:hypothetical protein
MEGLDQDSGLMGGTERRQGESRRSVKQKKINRKGENGDITKVVKR